MTRAEFLDLLARLRRALVGRARLRAPHKPLLLLWLFGRYAATGSTAAAYAEAEEPVSVRIHEYGPPVASASLSRQRAAMPFVHLEREIWDLRDGAGARSSRMFPSAGPGCGSPAAGDRAAAGRPGHPGGRRAAVAGPALHPGPGRHDLCGGGPGSRGAGAGRQPRGRGGQAESAASWFRRGGTARLRLPVRHVRLRWGAGP